MAQDWVKAITRLQIDIRLMGWAQCCITIILFYDIFGCRFLAAWKRSGNRAGAVKCWIEFAWFGSLLDWRDKLGN